MKATVCQLHNHGAALARDWQQLVMHVRQEHSDLVLLGEMPFCAPFVASPQFSHDTWNAAVEAHDLWEARFSDLEPAVIAASRPIDFGNERYNEAFIWSPLEGLQGVHAKAHLQSEAGAWEGRWYRSEVPDFEPASAAGATVGFLIGTELYAAGGHYPAEIDLLLIPRVDGPTSLESWLAAAREAARSASAFVLSSGHLWEDDTAAGRGWIMAPDGELLGMTSVDCPFLSMTLDPARARTCKQQRVRTSERLDLWRRALR